jgi:hypothetical protein
MKVKILAVHPEDAHWKARTAIVGRSGEFTQALDHGNGYWGGIIDLDEPILVGRRKFVSILFWKVKLEVLDHTPLKKIGFWGLTWALIKYRFFNTFRSLWNTNKTQDRMIKK